LEAFEIFDRYSDWYVKEHMDVSKYHVSLDFLLIQLQHSKLSVLDVACGPANLSYYFIQRRPNASIVGIDLSTNMLHEAKKHIPSGNFSILDMKNLEQVEGLFDVIFFGFAIPYCSLDECAAMIQKAALKLNHNGFLYISFIEGDYATSGWQVNSKGEQCMQYFYTKEQLLDIAVLNQLRCVHSQTIPSTNAGKIVDDYILIFTK
jgi:2-polyprenyl-3-methyl-5-hydroxy-6-metoxy-1,4-benzoquinol methylase